MRKIGFACIVALSLFGCTIHPIPFDTPGYRTIDIVNKIRCEVKRTLDKYAEQNPDKLRIYDAMKIGYKFTFTITENNKLGGGADFQLPLTHGTFAFGASGGAEKERVGTRDFAFVDNFKEAREPLVCTREATGPNYAYPITGLIGLEEVIGTYLELQAIGLGANGPVIFRADRPKSASPRKKEEKAKASETVSPDFAETFEFTTTINVGAKPSIELKPVGSGLSLVKGSVDLSAKRIDKHQLIITLSPNYNAALAALYRQDLSRRLQLIQDLPLRFPPQ